MNTIVAETGIEPVTIAYETNEITISPFCDIERKGVILFFNSPSWKI